MQCKSEPSPLAQGTLSEHCSHLVRPRFIPACAGNSFATLPSIFERPVHPRLRGELLMKMPSDQPYYGSSPLTRGTHRKFYINPFVHRFIPAYAGNSSTATSSRCGSTVHPRLRGELQQCSEHSFPSMRFIPAYAGNSQDLFPRITCSTVHPRLRGELSQISPAKSISFGSSPLTRGTRVFLLPKEKELRFIPAYAGNSSFTPEKYRRPSVHPRLRGELILFCQKKPKTDGSSPLTRGTHLKWLQHYTNRLTAKLLKNISKQE